MRASRDYPNRKSPQGMKPPKVIEKVFRRCMAEDRRTLKEIQQACRWEFSTGSDYEYPGDYDVRIQVGRVASRARPDGQWDFYPAYTKPVRFVSRARVLQLGASVRAGDNSVRELLREMVEDLQRGIKHWEAKHRRAREMSEEIGGVITQAAIPDLPIADPNGQMALL